jgi:hypothetical protein
VEAAGRGNSAEAALLDVAHASDTPLLDSAAAALGSEKRRRAAPCPETATPAASPPAIEVKTDHQDGVFRWTSRFDVAFDDARKECNITVRIRLMRSEGATEEDVAHLQELTNREFPRIWDNRFNVTDKATNTVYALRLGVAWVTDNDWHAMVFVRHGDGRSDMNNWYAGGQGDIRTAHELGHLLGLRDEYLDGQSPDRATPTGPGIHEDHSIMGDFFFEDAVARNTGDPQRAGARLRHGQTIAEEIGAATNRSFTASESAPPTPVAQR